MAIDKHITPSVSPLVVGGYKIGYNVYWGGSQVGDASGGAINFYCDNPPVPEEAYLALNDLFLLSDTAGVSIILYSAIGSLNEVGLSGPSGTTYIMGGVVYAAYGINIYEKQWQRPYYLGRMNPAQGGYSLIAPIDNRNPSTNQFILRGRLYLSPRAL